MVYLTRCNKKRNSYQNRDFHFSAFQKTVDILNPAPFHCGEDKVIYSSKRLSPPQTKPCTGLPDCFNVVA